MKFLTVAVLSLCLGTVSLHINAADDPTPPTAGNRSPSTTPSSSVADLTQVIESSDVIGKGAFQLQTGFEYVQDRHRNEPEKDVYETPTILRGGVTDTLELRVQSDGPMFEHLHNHGRAFDVGDVEFGAKWHAMDGDGDKLPSIAFSLSTAVPVHNGPFKIHDTEFTAALGWDLPFDLSLDTTLSVLHAFDTDTKKYFKQFNHSTILQMPVNDTLTAYAGSTVALPAAPHDHGEVTANAGFLISITDKISVDINASRGLTNTGQKFMGSTGLTIRWGK